MLIPKALPFWVWIYRCHLTLSRELLSQFLTCSLWTFKYQWKWVANEQKDVFTVINKLFHTFRKMYIFVLKPLNVRN